MPDAIAIPDTSDIALRAVDLHAQADALIVVDQDSYLDAGAFLLAVKEMRKQIDETFDPVIAAAHGAHKAALAAKAQHAAPVDEAERTIKRRVSNYVMIEERKRREEEARMMAEARRREEDARLAEAIALEAAGEPDLAESVIVAPLVVAPPSLPPPPKIAGVVARTTWAFRITDISIIPRQYLVPDSVKIGGVVRALRGQTHIPGVEVYEEKSIAVGGRR